MKHLGFPLLAALSVLFPCLYTRAQTSCTIDVPAIDSGFYDAHGEHDARTKSGTAGFVAGGHGRGAFRNFLAFNIPPFEGVVTGAVVVSSTSYAISPDGAETLQLYAVTTPVDVLRKGGFGLTNIYADLADGDFYGSEAFGSGFYGTRSVSLNASALAAITAARGQDFAIGGALASASSDPIYNEFISFPDYSSAQVMLQLQILVPNQPSVHGQPERTFLYSNEVLISVHTCGAEPLAHHWFVNGTNAGSTGSNPQFFFRQAPSSPAPVFAVVSNSFGMATSAVVQVHRIPARIDLPYTNLVLRVGDYYSSISPIVWSYTYPVGYVWLKDGAPFHYDPYFFFGPAQTTDSGNYVLVVSNSFGEVTSPTLRLEVVETPPIFWEQPRDVIVPLGSYAYLNFHAVGGPPPITRWYHDDVPLPVSSNSFLNLDNVTWSDAGNYYVVASNASGVVTSDVATVTIVLDPPVFTVQPQSRVVYPGHSIFFGVHVDGQPGPETRWYFNGQLVPGGFNSLTLPNVTSNDAGAYICVASNASGVVTSQVATLTVLYVPPVVSTLQDIAVPAGNVASFYITLSNPPAQVQWRLNGTNIPGASFSLPLYGGSFFHSYNLGVVDMAEGGLYSAVFSNAYGFTTSRVASLTVTTEPPFFEEQPHFSPDAALEGSTVELQLDVNGAPPPQLFLYRNGTNTGLSFQGNFFELPGVTLADSGDYFIVASNIVGMATSAVARLEVQRAGPLDRWNVRSPFPQANDLFAVAYGGGRFVAVGRNGALISSADGTNWNRHSIRTNAELQGVTYGGGRFVVVGEGSLILTSTNGENWVTAPVSPLIEFFDVTYGNGRFVIAGRPNFTASPKILVSSNGLDWVDATFLTPSASWLRAIAYGAGAFVTIDAGSQALRSTDLATWTTTASSLNASESVKFLEGGFFVTGQGGRIAQSSDGISWTVQIVNTLRLYDVAHGSGAYVAVGARGLIMRSADATAWTPVPSSTVNRLEGIVYGNNLFVAVGESGTILTSSNGQSWANQLRVTGEDLDGMTVGGGLAAAVGKNDTILTSPNGRDWTRATMPPSTNGEPRDWHGVGYGDGKFVVVGQTKDILVSSNGVDWEKHGYDTPVFNPYLKSVTYAAGVWVAVGTQGHLLTSSDARFWLPFDATVLYDLNEVTYGNGMFVVVGDRAPDPNATILTSTNGTNWINRSIATGKNARGITFADGLFVMTLNDGRILHTRDPNSYNWFEALTGVNQEGNNLRGATSSNGLSVAVGNTGLIITSTNATAETYNWVWRRRVTPTEENLHAVRYINGTFVAVGNAGTILQSDPLISQLAATREGTNLRLTFSSPDERIFKLQYADEFAAFPPANPWHDLAFITNVIGTVDYTVPLPAGGGHKFYRVIAP